MVLSDRALLIVTVCICTANFVAITEGNYILQVRLYSYSNPSQRCAECVDQQGIKADGPRCCDSNEQTCRLGMETPCDTFYKYCLRELGSSGSTATGLSGQMITSDINENDRLIDFSSEVVLGLRNPFPLPGLTSAWNGIQLHIQVVDRDPLNNFDDIIDRFYINILAANVTIGVESVRTTYRGMFGLAQMDLSFKVVCAENFAGADCSECMPGYTDPFCRTNIDDCEGVDCCGHGQCEDRINTYLCVCQPGYTGETCQMEIKECEETTCNGHGRCVNTDGSVDCKCNSGFKGNRCQKNIDDCVGVNCSGRGQCIDGVNNFTCSCNTGFGGKLCEHNINNCIGINCSGNGQCVSGLNTYVCACVSGFKGKNCEININDCAGVKCNGNGTCVDGIDSFTCVCNPGLTGELCDQLVLRADSNPKDYMSQYLVYLGAGLGAILLILTILVCVLIMTTALKRKDKRRQVNADPDNMLLQRNETYNFGPRFVNFGSTSGSGHDYDSINYYETHSPSNTPTYDYIS